jgi:hypothetical protein
MLYLSWLLCCQVGKFQRDSWIKLYSSVCMHCPYHGTNSVLSGQSLAPSLHLAVLASTALLFLPHCFLCQYKSSSLQSLTSYPGLISYWLPSLCGIANENWQVVLACLLVHSVLQDSQYEIFSFLVPIKTQISAIHSWGVHPVAWTYNGIVYYNHI